MTICPNITCPCRLVVRFVDPEAFQSVRRTLPFLLPSGDLFSTARGSWLGGRRAEPQGSRMLLAFERLLVNRTLPGRLVDPWWVGPADSTQFLHLIDDLTWALLHSHRDTRPIYHLQISSFPLPIHRTSEAAQHHWRFASPGMRRALFAMILALAGPEEGRVALTGSKREPRFTELLTFLGYRNSALGPD